MNTTIKKPAGASNTNGPGTTTINDLDFTGWRGALAISNPAFRVNGSYDVPADARRLRRLLERKAKKILAKGKSHG